MKAVNTMALFAIIIIMMPNNSTIATPRVVVTFRNASLNSEATVPENATVVKQYGRRLVLRLSEDKASATEWIHEVLGGEDLIEQVESDVLASAFIMNNSTENYTETSAPAFISNTLWNSGSTSPITKGWNLDEAEPYALHIQSLRSLTDGRGATISIIDSGIAEAAKAIFAPVNGYDFISSPDYTNKINQARNPDYTDPGDQGPTCPTPSWHGTKVTSIVAAIAPGASLNIMRVLGQCGVGFSSDIADAIVWAAGGQINGLGPNAYPATAISLSLAGKAPCPTYLQSAVNQAMSLGVMVIAAAGNAAQNVSGYFPANCKGVVAVGASTRQGTLASYSNWGEGLAFSAPGGDADNPIRVLSLDSTGALTPTFAIGTSFSAPHAAGFASLKLDLAAVLIPFSSCSGGICGRGILSHAAQSEQAQAPQVGNNSITGWVGPGTAVASTVCPGIMHDNVYMGAWAGKAYYTSADKNEDSSCPSPCYVDKFEVCSEYGYTQTGFVSSYRYRCSDGTWSGAYGSQSTCSHATVPASSPGGFTAVFAMGFDHIYGMLFKTVDGQYISLGNMKNADTYLSCGDYSIDSSTTINRRMTGIKTSSNADNVNGFALYCGSFECGANYYMSNYVCYTCDRCDVNQYASGCGGGTASGTCLACASSCGDTQYLSGCGGVSPGSCAYCAGCGAGETFGGCTGGGLSDGRTCTSCVAGKYGGGGRSRTCTDCGAGKYNPDQGSASEASCRQCPSGKYNPNSGSAAESACQSCAAGKYSLYAGETSCTSCDYGQYSTKAGNNYYCSGCVAGTYNGLRGQTVCIQCGAGKYNPATMSTGIGYCGFCYFGTYSTTLGAPSETTCTPCRQGKYGSSYGSTTCEMCLPGTYGPSTSLTVCADCASGTYTTASGLISTCANCEAGKYNAGTGASSSNACSPCQAGSYASSPGLSVCQSCSPGTYTGTVGSASCAPCPPETFTVINGTVQCQVCVARTDCITAFESRCIANFGTKCVACDFIYACVYPSNKCFVSGSTTNPSCLCNPGFEMVNNQCTGCAAGKFKATAGSDACAPMTAIAVCPKGTYLQTGTAFSNSACIACPSLPSNAIDGASGCEWSCSAGFDNNAP